MLTLNKDLYVRGRGETTSSSVIGTTGSNRFRCPPVQPVRRSPLELSSGGEKHNRGDGSASRALHQSSSSTSADPMTAVVAEVIWISLSRR
ncbi:hypothetical protein NL676_001033 [Syzygium grande]|nr:hypothetical protein NL676_001033 [Syzygium grande]